MTDKDFNIVESAIDDYCMRCPEDTLNNDNVCERCHIRKFMDKIKEKDNKVKVYIVHIYLGCCINNSDGKVWVIASNKEKAKDIVKAKTTCEILYVEEVNVENEIIYSSANWNGPINDYRFKQYENTYGDCNELRKKGKCV